MQRRNRDATAALLQKANCQLRGEKIAKPEDELNAYISSLTQKTVKSQKSVNFEDHGDSISISSDIEDVPNKQEGAGSGGSKFLKKKSVNEPDASPAPAANKFLKKPQSSAAAPVTSVAAKQRYGSQPATSSVASSGQLTRSGGQLGQGRQASSVLDKMSAVTGKIQQRAATRKTFAMESDSDESFSAVKISGSADVLSESQTSDSVKIGRDGGKFLKKAAPQPKPSIEPPLSTQSNKVTMPAPTEKQQQQAKKAPSYQLKSSLRHSTDVILTSEEESLAEYVGGLPSSSDSMDRSRRNQYKRGPSRRTPSPPLKTAKGRQSPSPTPQKKSEPQKDKNRSVSPPHKPPVIRRTPSPSPRSPGLRRRSPSPKLLRSISDDSNMADSIQDEVAEDFDIGVNVIMDLDDLGPAQEVPSRPDTPRSSSDSPVRSSVRPSKQPGKSRENKQTDKGSPFRATEVKSESVFKSSDKHKDKSPFRASAANESPFKSSSSKQKSAYRDDQTDSPFKASNKENKSPFKKSEPEISSPFKAKGESSPFKSSTGSSLFKASGKGSSPFKSSSAGKSSSPFKASSVRSISPVTERSESKSVSRRKDKKTKKSEKNKKKESKKTKAKDDVFSSLGIQTVEDLLGQTSVSVREVSDYGDTSHVDEVPSEVSEEIKTERVYSSVRYDDSATEVASEIEEVKPSAPSYTDDFDSISEKIGYSSDRGRSSASEVRTKYSEDETVASYTEYSESETDTETYSDSRSRSQEDYSYTSYTEDFTKSVVPTATSRSDVTPRPPRGKASTEVQTTVEGLLYSWDAAGSGMAYPGIPYGLHFVDPSPIASHVVSADALEAMTAYSPAMLALHDLLRSQLELTREFLEMQKRVHAEADANIQPRYHYTTLEDTKKYIQKNKKKKLTFKEALKLVDLEMVRS